MPGPRRRTTPAPLARQTRLAARSAIHYADIERLPPALAARVSLASSGRRYLPAPFEGRLRANTYTQTLLDRYNAAQASVANRDGLVCASFRDIHLIGKIATLCDIESRTVLTGAAVGLGSGVLEKNRTYLESKLLDASAVRHVADGPAHVLIDQPGIRAYGHFLLDIVPKIHIFETLIGGDCIYLLRFLDPWMRGILETVGVGSDRLMKIDDTALYHFDALHVPFTIKRGYGVNLDVLSATWRHVTGRSEASGSTSGRRLFVRRNKGLARSRATNEDDMFAVAERFGFEALYPESFSFAEQIKLFAGAELVAGEDGSGLHNAMFAEYGKAVLCYMRPERDNLWHLACAQAAGMDFHAIKCKASPAGYSADPGEFEALLNFAAGLPQ